MRISILKFGPGYQVQKNNASYDKHTVRHDQIKAGHDQNITKQA